MKVAIRVKPGASRTRVGGASQAGELIVTVTERAVDGQATRAVRKALARALGVAPSRLSLVRGERSRVKLFEITGDQDALAARVAALRSGTEEGPGNARLGT